MRIKSFLFDAKNALLTNDDYFRLYHYTLMMSTKKNKVCRKYAQNLFRLYIIENLCKFHNIFCKSTYQSQTQNNLPLEWQEVVSAGIKSKVHSFVNQALDDESSAASSFTSSRVSSVISAISSRVSFPLLISLIAN